MFVCVLHKFISYATIYACMLLTGVAVYCVVFIIYTYGSIRASRTIHKQLVDSVLGTTLRWLDTTPTSRVITRATQDMRDSVSFCPSYPVPFH